MNDDLGDRMKGYEAQTSSLRLDTSLPILARIDGRAFHTFTRDFTRPFDERLTECMILTTIDLVKETGARVGYTQSDEISLLWYEPDPRKQVWFDGRLLKMTSLLGAAATLFFYKNLWISDDRNPMFDARVWNVPSKTEATNTFVWRELDATKNSVSMAAAANFTPKELHGKTTEERKQLLLDKGINWESYPDRFKRGTYVQRRTELLKLTPKELARLPEKHAARKDPDLTYERSTVSSIVLPPITQVVNRTEVLFDGEPWRIA